MENNPPNFHSDTENWILRQKGAIFHLLEEIARGCIKLSTWKLTLHRRAFIGHFIFPTTDPLFCHYILLYSKNIWGDLEIFESFKQIYICFLGNKFVFNWRALLAISSFQEPTYCFVIKFCFICFTPKNICVVHEIFVSIKQIFVVKEIYLRFIGHYIFSTTDPVFCHHIYHSRCLFVFSYLKYSSTLPPASISFEIRWNAISMNIGKLRQNRNEYCSEIFKDLDSMHISRCEKLWNIWGHIYVIKTALALALALYKSPQGPETTIKIWDPWTRWWQWPAFGHLRITIGRERRKSGVRSQIGRQICRFFCQL